MVAQPAQGNDMSGMDKPLYDQDFVRWTEEQAHALRAAAATRLNAPIDWENVAEEVEDLGKSRRNELASRMQTIIEHLMKLQTSPTRLPRRGWEATVVRERGHIRRLLKESPSLHRFLPELMAEAHADACRVVERELRRRREGSGELHGLTYTEDQVLGDWFPD